MNVPASDEETLFDPVVASRPCTRRSPRFTRNAATAALAGIAALCLGAACALGAAGSPSPSAPGAPSASPSPGSVTDQLQAVLERRIAERAVEPSISAAVFGPDGSRWSGAAGVTTLGGDVAATTDTVYAMASISKTFVATLVLLLVTEGVLDLDDKAEQWLDDAAAEKSNGATIRQLLAHRSGIASYTARIEPRLATPHNWTVAELVELIGEPLFIAGSSFAYSNSDYLLLGLVAERAGGASLEDLLRTRLFTPLGLERTFLSGREQIEPPFAHGHGRFTSLTGDLYDGSGYLPNETLATSAWAAGAVASTPSDVAHFLAELRRGAVLGADLTAKMFDFASAEFGLGVHRAPFPGGETASGHAGAIPGYVALAFHFASNGSVTVVATNTDVEDLYVTLVELAEIADGR